LQVCVTMLGFTRGRREALSETLRELANLTPAALVPGQIVGREPHEARLMEGAVIFMAMLAAVALVLAGFALRDERKERESRDRAA
jgi:hypothetical protein